MAKKSNNNKDIRHGDRTRQNKDEMQNDKSRHQGERSGDANADIRDAGGSREGGMAM